MATKKMNKGTASRPKARSTAQNRGSTQGTAMKSAVMVPTGHAGDAEDHASVEFNGLPFEYSTELNRVTESLSPRTLGKAMFNTEHLLRTHEERFETQEDDEGVLDAWFGEYGTSASRAAVNEGLSEGRLMTEVIIGEDDRTQVLDPMVFPFRCICSLLISMPNGTKFVGTGWLAGPKVVITAGHCVYLIRHGGWARQISVMPARNGSAKPYLFHATRFRSVKGWIEQRRPESDYGAIVLDEPIADTLGHFGYASLKTEELENAMVNVAGYPGDKPGTMWGHTRRLVRVTGSQLVYDVDTYGGNSGGPVIVWEGDSYQSVGIHNYGDLTGNSATRINDAVFDRINSWVEST